MKLLSLSEAGSAASVARPEDAVSPYTIKDLTPGASYQVQLFTVYEGKESGAYTSRNFTTSKFIVVLTEQDYRIMGQGIFREYFLKAIKDVPAQLRKSNWGINEKSLLKIWKRQISIKLWLFDRPHWYSTVNNNDFNFWYHLVAVLTYFYTEIRIFFKKFNHHFFRCTVKRIFFFVLDCLYEYFESLKKFFYPVSYVKFDWFLGN